MRYTMPLPSFTDLRAQFEYNEDTGVLQYRKLSTQQRRARGEAGSISSANGRLRRTVMVEQISGPGKYYFAHRVIWKLMTAEEPPDEIDHINGDPLDNRWANLRDGSDGVNGKNRALYSKNTSGYCGVSWDKCRGMWSASVGIERKSYSIGYYEDKKEAARAAKEFRDRHGFTERHGTKR